MRRLCLVAGQPPFARFGFLAWKPVGAEVVNANSPTDAYEIAGESNALAAVSGTDRLDAFHMECVGADNVSGKVSGMILRDASTDGFVVQLRVTGAPRGTTSGLFPSPQAE